MMKDFDVKFEHLQLFHKLCLTQSLNSICEEFKISYPEILKQLRELEDDLNTKLISNFYKPFTLTESGKKLFEITTRISFDIGAVEKSLMIKHEPLENDFVNIYVSTSIVFSAQIANKTNHIIEKIPEVFMDLSFHDNLTLDKFNKKDIFISTMPFIHDLAENHILHPIDMTLAVSKEYVYKNGIPKFISSMPNHTFIYTTCYDYKRLFQPHELQYLSKKYLVDSELASIIAIESGFGIGIMPKFLRSQHPNLILFELEKPLGHLNLTISIPKMRKTSYIDLIVEILANEIRIPNYDQD